MASNLAAVAARAGVSQSTVSRVLNARPGISPTTRAAVLAALADLGYERPVKLREGRARLVGLVLPALSAPAAALTEVVSGALARRGFAPVLCTGAGETLSEEAYTELLFAQAVSGAVFLGGGYQFADGRDEPYRRLAERGLPTVLLNAGDLAVPLPHVSIEDGHAAGLAREHLTALGHRDIGLLLGPETHLPSRRWLAAHRAAFSGAAWPELVTRTELTAEDGQAAATRLVAAGATALVCADHALTMGAVRAARRLGLSVPRDVSLIGFDDDPALTHTEPPLTTLRRPVEAMGRAVVSLLLERIGGLRGGTEEMLFDAELVVRASTGAPRRASD
ncbi:LacI family DNA-binding transcriptional regulator [Phytomonospora endophytica]|uniref:DNA-binding LacI/PurR family transcriptional regulator n=1 Tax=Phytomonospora endophytica TaxID=714109 RepID=A0A841FL75_9ACTN|nr:LacI family DNA-binding transcriptional regulator [Phytomonospora endophytica]MBB6034302.1 DNA-binding LacI/PurR family transcriptional regulator [Phytomonospora endophytica]GIG66696.1 LacI family transcriptional regulator [Phytomonospora endophytica]